MSSTKIFVFESSMLKREVELTDNILTAAFFGRDLKSSLDVESIESMEIKPVSMTGGAEIKLTIFHQKDGKKIPFPDRMGFDSRATDEVVKALVKSIQTINPEVEIIDQRNKASSKKSREGDLLPIIPTFFGLNPTTLPRWLILCIYTICFAPLIIPIPFLIYLFIKGYLIHFDKNGVAVTKVLSKFYRWSEIQHISLREMTIESFQGYHLGDAVNFKLELADGKSVRFTTQYTEAKTIVEKFVEHDKAPSQIKELFAI